MEKTNDVVHFFCEGKLSDNGKTWHDMTSDFTVYAMSKIMGRVTFFQAMEDRKLGKNCVGGYVAKASVEYANKLFDDFFEGKMEQIDRNLEKLVLYNPSRCAYESSKCLAQHSRDKRIYINYDKFVSFFSDLKKKADDDKKNSAINKLSIHTKIVQPPYAFKATW